ncbi:uncharacterized protein LOC133342167 [Lethenteron reissneri]|uniref:uncharacterized protein LOC133342167 n=1 Tax=Lethenteron reissneri TaxID=7753 RepID=UPI002AB66E83|nr:uncharacterized protein LOC133342167 [Lethenteron reissneri]
MSRAGYRLLCGPWMEREHCVIENTGGDVTLLPMAGATCCVNGRDVSQPCRLHQGSVILLGRTHMFRFNHPAQAAKLRQRRSVGEFPQGSWLSLISSGSGDTWDGGDWWPGSPAQTPTCLPRASSPGRLGPKRVPGAVCKHEHWGDKGGRPGIGAGQHRPPTPDLLSGRVRSRPEKLHSNCERIYFVEKRQSLVGRGEEEAGGRAGAERGGGGGGGGERGPACARSGVEGGEEEERPEQRALNGGGRESLSRCA